MFVETARWSSVSLLIDPGKPLRPLHRFFLGGRSARRVDEHSFVMRSSAARAEA